MRNLSRSMTVMFWVILAGMLGLALFALTRPAPPAPANLETAQAQTIEAGLSARLTQIAAGWTATPPPNIDETIEARVSAELNATSTRTPTPTPTTEPSIVDRVIGENSAIGSIWGFFGGIGWLAQVLCCLLLPGLVVLGIVADPRRK